METQQKKMKEKLRNMNEQLAQLAAKHSNALLHLKDRHKLEYKEKEAEFQKAGLELEWLQGNEMRETQSTHAQELDEANLLYLRELEMDNQVRSMETKALQERKVLNSLLDTIVDGVVSIDPMGQIMRFKYVRIFVKLTS